MSKEPEFIYPDGPAPANVKAVSTTRTGGFSKPPFDSFNLGKGAGDDPQHVRQNRELLAKSAGLPSEPVWLRQRHSHHVVDAACAARGAEADGSYATEPGVVCAVLTADCCPVFLCDRQGTRVAVLHGGWRGLARGVIEEGIQSMGVAGSELFAWLGPAIGPTAFEVGEDVHEAFVEQDADAAEAFAKRENGRWLADIYTLARRRLNTVGVKMISGGGYCTFCDREKFFSYRRDGASGRMASLIWLDGH